MPPRIWLVFAVVLVVCGVPCSAQRIGSFGSRAGGFGRGPGFTHMGSPGFSQRSGVSRFSTRPPGFSGFPRSQSTPPMHGFRDWPGTSQSFRNDGAASGLRLGARPLVPRPPLRPSLPMASGTLGMPRPPQTSAMPIRAGASPVPRPPQAASVVLVRAEALAVVPRPPRTSAAPAQAATSAAALPASRFATDGQLFGPRSSVFFSSGKFFFNPFFPNAFFFPRPFFFSPFFVNPLFFPDPFFFSPFFSDAFFFPKPFFFSPFFPSAFFPQPFFFSSFGSSPFFFGSSFRSPFLSSPFVPFSFRPGVTEHQVHLLGTSGLSSAGFTKRQP